MTFFDIWVAVRTPIGSIASSLTALPVLGLGNVLRWVGLRPPLPLDRVPGLLEEVRDDQRGLVAGQTTIIGDQHGLAAGQNIIGQDLKALVDVVRSLDKNLMAVVDNQNAMLKVMTAISDQIEKSGGDLNSRSDNVMVTLGHVVSATESSTEAIRQVSALVEELSGRRTAQSEPASKATQTQDTSSLEETAR
jgi:prefoldin subunit 5